MQPIASKHSGIALKMWGNVMSKIHSGLKEKEFTDSSYAVDKFYCTATGKLATEACPKRAVGWYKKSNLPGVCTAHSGTVLGKPADILAAEKKAEEEAKKKEEAAQSSAGSTGTGSTQSTTSTASSSTSSSSAN